MEAGQIIPAPCACGNAQAPTALAADSSVTQGTSSGLFGELLGQNLLSPQGFYQCGVNQDAWQLEAEPEPTTDIITVLTKELVEQDTVSTELDPTRINQLSAYTQLAVLQANLPVQQQVTNNTEQATELPMISDVTTVRLESQMMGADLNALPVVGDTQVKQKVVQGVDGQFQEVGISHSDTGEVEAKAVPVKQKEFTEAGKSTIQPQSVVLSTNQGMKKNETGVTSAVDGQVQLLDATIKAESEKQLLKSQISGQEVIQKTVEAPPVQQEVSGSSKPVMTAVQQPVRFAQQPDVVLAATGAEGQKNSAAGQQNQGSQLMPKGPENLAMHGELVKPELAGDTVTPFRLPEQHVVSLHMVQQAVDSTASVVTDSVKPVPQELIGRQVTDRLASHEIKQGNDQISFKLSPENMGTLQLNMRMEDNRLKLEIVAENRGVRDALLQQSDDLKETLARQNIKVDSFNVTMSSNGNQSQQSQDWRQMMPERHQQASAQYASRTNLNSGKLEASMQYFAPQYQSTLDVRF